MALGKPVKQFNVTVTTTTNTDNYSGVSFVYDSAYFIVKTGKSTVYYPLSNLIRVVTSET